MINGRVLYIDRSKAWLSQGRKVLISRDGGQTWNKQAMLPNSCIRHMLTVNRLGRRLGRAGFHHFELTKQNSGIAIAHKNIFYMTSNQNLLSGGEPLIGSRPLKFCIGNGMAYYGEYRGNIERSCIHVWGASVGEKMWHPVWHFEKVRHVHGVFFDPYSSAFWVTTGDEDHECAIWMSPDGFRTLEKIVGGSQQFRCVQLLFTSDHIYFGSDALYEANFIYRMDRKAGYIEKLIKVGGTVFHGCKVGHNLFFSTAVEPSTFNNRYAEIWGSADGEKWKIIKTFRKDRWPMKLFQYGQVFFPSGPGDGRNLWCTPMATEYDQKTLKMPIEELFDADTASRQ